MKQNRRAAIGYAVLFLLELGAALWMAGGMQLTGRNQVLSETRLRMFKYFTVDSNVLMGIVACILAVLNLQVLRGKRKEVPEVWHYLNLAATTGVCLTLLVTACFLAPMFGAEWLDLYTESNFFLHLVNPVAAAVLFVTTERKKTDCFPTTLAGLAPTVAYAVYYMAVVFLNTENGIVSDEADWYGFLLSDSISGAPAVVIIIMAATWLISFALWFLQQKAARGNRG